MKSSIRQALVLSLIGSLSAFSFAQEINVTQIDSSRLLSGQTVRLFVDMNRNDDSGVLDPSTVTVSESADGSDFVKVKVRKISRSDNQDEGISFFLLLDNSGSMWDGLDGKPTEDSANMRITHAKRAALSFLDNLSVLDRAGLATFNTSYTPIAPISADISGLPSAVNGISKPTREEAYTELYGAIGKALAGFGESGRRKVLIVLSDGEHFPLRSQDSDFGTDEALVAANREGVTCYVVRFGNDRDSQVSRIATGSGGLVFDAQDGEEILGVYNAIRSGVLEEYSITYTAAMLPGDRRWVRVTDSRAAVSGQAQDSSRYYYTGTVLGHNTRKPEFWYLLVAIVPLLAWLALLVFKLERETSEPGIRLLYGASGMHTREFALTGSQTIIGGSEKADITIAGNPSMKASAATIIFDEKKGQYTITANADLTVNNQPVKTRKLESGDVINMAGTVVVFDKGAKIK